jgi:hypothetical protein
MNVKYAAVILSGFMLMSCTKSESDEKYKILDTPVTKLSRQPIEFDSATLAELKKVYNFDGVADISDLGGLEPQYKMALVYYVDFPPVMPSDSCIKYGGCLLTWCFRMIISNADDSIIVIKNRDEFKSFFAPVSSAEEAISYITALTRCYPAYEFSIEDSYRIYTDVIHKTYVKQLANGFEVHLYCYAFCGCGPHPFSEYVFNIDREGNFEVTEENVIYEDPSEDGLCVD